MVSCPQDLEEYKYTCEPGHMEWTPLNSNLTMQGIKASNFFHQKELRREGKYFSLSLNHSGFFLCLQPLHQLVRTTGKSIPTPLTWSGASEPSDPRDNNQQLGELARGHTSPPRPDEAQEAAGGPEEEGELASAIRHR